MTHSKTSQYDKNSTVPDLSLSDTVDENGLQEDKKLKKQL